MGCCCPKTGDDGARSTRPSRDSRRATGSTPPPHAQRRRSSRQQQQQSEYVAAARPSTFTCPKCGVAVDSALFDGHRETCRLQRAQQPAAAAPAAAGVTRQDSGGGLRRTSSGRRFAPCPHCGELVHAALLDTHKAVCRKVQQQHGSPTEAEVRDEELCCVCYSARREQAFVPCGHWACCKGCARLVQDCPLCRSDITGRVDVEPAVHVDVCPVCKLHIHPTFFVSHREVCRIQLQRRRRLSQQEEQKGGGDSEIRPTARCVVCNDGPRDAAFVPCGHLLCCASCAGSRETCPSCCRHVRSVLPIWT